MTAPKEHRKRYGKARHHQPSFYQPDAVDAVCHRSFRGEIVRGRMGRTEEKRVPGRLLRKSPVDPDPGGKTAHTDDRKGAEEENDLLRSVEGEIHRRRILMLPSPDSSVIFNRSDVAS